MKKILVIILVFAGNIVSIAQNTFNIPQIIPASPQAQIFEKYIFHEVKGYNGLPEITIPVYEIKLKNLTIPIYLSYHAGGVKYRQYDGELGAGWSINAGGFRVNRSQFDKPDESYELENINSFNSFIDDHGYSGDNILVDAYLASLCPDYGNYYELKNKKEGVYFDFKDSSHDLFTYILPTTNGNFIIKDRNTKEVLIAEVNQDKLQYQTKTGIKKLPVINSIIIYDNRGNRFDLGESSNKNQLYIETNQTLDNSSWLLSNIKTPYNEQVQFSYIFHKLPPTRLDEIQLNITDAQTNLGDRRGHPNEYKSYSGPYIQSPTGLDQGYISNINVEDLNLNIEFKHKEKIQGEDPYTLGEIIITQNGNQLKKIVLNYINAPEFYKNELKHTLLKNLFFYGDDNKVMTQQYSFEYYLPNSPESTSLYWYPDMWGYYKFGNKSLGGGSIDENFIKNQYIDRTTSEGHTAHYLNLNFANTGNVFFQNKYENNTSHLFTLKKIVYPTGGSTEYTYEPHQFTMQKDGKEIIINGGGHRVKEIISKTEEDVIAISTKYKYGKNGDGIGTIGGIAGNYEDYRFLFADETYSFSTVGYPLDPKTYSLMTTNRLFTSTPSFPLFDRYMNISYNTYSIENSSGNTFIGKEIYKYSLNNYTYMNEYTLFTGNYNSDLSYGYGNWYINCYNIGGINKLSEKTYINHNNDTVKQEIFNYIPVNKKTIEDVLIKQKNFLEHYNYNDMHPGQPYSLFNSLFNYGSRKIDISSSLLASKAITEYRSNKKVTIWESYEYDKYYQLKKTNISNSSGSEFTKMHNYPYDYPEDRGYADLVSRNMISTPIEEIERNNNREINRKRINYIYNSLGTIRRSRPSSITHSTTGEDGFRNIMTYDRFDDYNDNTLQYTRLDGIKISYLWGYNSQYPIVEFINAEYNQVLEAMKVLSISWDDVNSANMSKINLLRQKLPDSQITTYTYKPLVGVLTMTAPRGVTTYYDYDTFGRLKETYIIENGVKKIIQVNEYHYQNQ